MVSLLLTKLRLTEMQLPEKYKETFDVAGEGPSSVSEEKGPSLETSKFSLYSSGSCIPIN
jgi:hypothetical protein